MPASQAGRRRFDPGRPLHSFPLNSKGLRDSARKSADRRTVLSPIHYLNPAEVEPHRASIRSIDGETVGSTDASTVCWAPRKPSAFAAYSEKGREHVLRCGWCGGCREFDRRRLAKRLVAHYRNYAGDLWLVVVRCGLKLQSALCARLHRCQRRLNVDPPWLEIWSDPQKLDS